MRSSKFQGASFSDGTESKSNRRNAAKPALQRTATLSTLATEIVRISYGKYTCVDLKDHKYVIYTSCKRTKIVSINPHQTKLASASPTSSCKPFSIIPPLTCPRPPFGQKP
ncbi:hypothetical protein YC2023_007942 [Brassica napus]|uniref:(rape) hypothetical protein n=1 Tax=Brassica napus TaxID=3708 RepID=A0A816R7G6_BRANA|nr:unnamed protein product [Brassica napus]